MIKFEHKNKWAIDVSLHIPIPSISLSVTKTDKESEEFLNSPLHRTPSSAASTAAASSDAGISSGAAAQSEQAQVKETVQPGVTAGESETQTESRSRYSFTVHTPFGDTEFSLGEKQTETTVNQTAEAGQGTVYDEN